MVESPEKFPESSDSPFSNDGSINSREFFDDAMLLWLLMTWLIKGSLSKLSGVLSEIGGGLLDLVYLWLTNQIAELH